MAVTAFIVSMVALLLSGAAVHYTRRQAVASERVAVVEEQRRAEEIAAQQATVAAGQRANITAEVMQDGASRPGAGYLLVVRNSGPAAARDLTVSAEDKGPQRWLSEALEPLDLEAGGTRQLHMFVNLGDPGVHKVRLRWTDGSGPQDEVRNCPRPGF